VDASGAIGWFTASFPLRLRATTNPFASAQALAARLQALPSGGAGFLALLAWRPQVLGQEACKTFAHDCRLAFNYLGELAVSAPDDHPETHAGVHITQSPQQPDDAHSDVDPQLERPRPVTVEAWTQGEALVLRATFDPADWPQGQASLEATAAVLADLLRHDPRLAPLPSLSDGELDSLMNELGI